MNANSLRRAVLLAGVACCLECTPALAESAAQPERGQTAGEPEAEIIVTAQKRAQGLAEVPISIAAVNADRIQATGADDVSSFASQVPNFNVYEGYDRASVAVNVRGLTSGTSNPGIDSSVGFFIDGVYIARPASLTGKLTDIQRFEVLRGPQGTLYGRNTSAGAVNIYTKDPERSFGGDFMAGYGSYNLVDVRGRVTGPVGDHAGFSVSGYYSRQDNYLKNAVTGKSIGSSEDFGFRAKFFFEPSDAVKVKLIADYSKGTTDASRIVGVFQKDQRDLGTIFQIAQQTRNPALVGFIRGVKNVPLPFSRKTLRSATPEADNLEQYGVSGQVDYDLGPVTVTSISAYRESRVLASVDADISPLDLFKTYNKDKDTQFSQELRIANNQPFGGVDFLLGLFYFKSTFARNTQTSFGVPLFGQYNATRPANPITTPQSANSKSNLNADAFAVFGQISYEITDKLKATYGFRWNDEVKKGVVNQDPDRGINLSSGIPFPLQFPIFVDLTGRVASKDFINMVSLNYQFSRNSNLYATFSQGLKSGGVNASILLNASGLTFAKETSTNYEIGYRNIFGNGMQVSLAAYYTNFKNLQIQTFDPSNPANVIVANAGKARIYGLEGDLFWPMTKSLGLNLSGAYNHSEYVDTSLPGTVTAQNPALPGISLQVPATVSVDGKPLARAPKLSISGGLQYAIPLRKDWKLTLRSDVQYRSSQYLDATLPAESFIGGYTTVNLRASLANLGSSLSLSVYANNVFNEEYYSQVLASPAAAGLAVLPTVPTFFGVQGPPRVIGVELRKSF